jgi:hypothetical protein
MTQTAQHTSGPWTYQYSPYPYRDGDEIPAFEVHGDEVKVCDTNETRPTEEQEANARLIAAAPEMLGALEDLLAHAEYFCPQDLGLKVYEQARLAIAKAKGGAA